MARVLAWPIERVVIAHGRTYQPRVARRLCAAPLLGCLGVTRPFNPTEAREVLRSRVEAIRWRPTIVNGRFLDRLVGSTTATSRQLSRSQQVPIARFGRTEGWLAVGFSATSACGQNLGGRRALYLSGVLAVRVSASSFIVVGGAVAPTKRPSMCSAAVTASGRVDLRRRC